MLDEAWTDPSPEIPAAARTRATPSSGPTPVAAQGADDGDKPIRISGGGRKRTIMVACAALLLGGAGLAVYDVVSGSNSSSAKSGVAADQAESAPLAAINAPPSDAKVVMPKVVMPPEVLYDRAVGVLAELRKSPSLRIERLATMALARTGDEDAKAGLTRLLKTEKSSLNRIALAYALARSGGDAGRAVLVEGLSHARRDVRSDASIALLNLGDDSGRGPLNRMTSLRHYKLSACEHLARAGDARARALLEKVYKDPSEDAETVLRAGVALGRAGDPSVAEYLRSTLADGRFQVGAADALAALGDKAAIEPLTRQLELNAMRVRAALALRRLEASVSLEPLGVALTEDDEVTRVTAAEALLILTGSKELAQRD